MRTKYCGELRLSDVNQKVSLCGWVECKKNFGNFIFINLRDCKGIVQIFFNKQNFNIFNNLLTIKNESCIQIIGIVKERSKKNKNKRLKTGDIEVIGKKIKIFNSSPPLPININNIDDDTIRLKYRYLDLRRLKMFQNLKIRSKIIDIIRIFMNKNNFLNIETPVLTKSTPEGAKDYLVSSRTHKNKYYALPQSPQLFKQLLMISGVDRYYQIVKCFRDEDLRSDRQPEFTQIDLEASFINQDTIFKLIESMIKILWKKIINYKLESFPIISFNDAIKKYGSDKPDLRNPLKLFDISHRIINNILCDENEKNIRTAGLIVPNGLLLLNQNKINTLDNIIKKYDKIFYMYIHVKNVQLNQYDIFNTNKKINHEAIAKIFHKHSVKNKDIIYIISGKYNIVNQLFNKLRNLIWKMINIISQNLWKPVWIIDFPMFTRDDNNHLSSVHHPFTSPKNATINDIISNPESIISNAYDLVINGYEIGGGSVRIHNYDMQVAILKILNIFNNKKKNTFDFFINALQYGTPPHAGIALGLDRITMLLTNSDSIKEVIAFPKTNSAKCLMTNAPSEIIY